MEKYLVLDIETQKWAQEVEGGWNNIPAFKLAIAVTMEVDGYGTYPAYFRDEKDIAQTYYVDKYNDKFLLASAATLIETLYWAPMIVTFNGIHFDYEVLRLYGLKPELLYPKSFDILYEMQKALGHRVSLESVAQATLREGKIASGIEAVKWYKEGKIDRIIEYCEKDVEITRHIYEFIQKHGYAHYLSLQGEVKTCRLKAETDK